jgi:uncharacterized protein YciI
MSEVGRSGYLARGTHALPPRHHTRRSPFTLTGVSAFVFRLKAPRPTFALDMTDEEREIMARHAAYWRPLIDSGQMVVFGPVLDASGSWGLGVIEADDEEELRTFAAGDPVVTSGTATVEVGRMLAGFVRPRPSSTDGMPVAESPRVPGHQGT